jgi:hypothetical protein
MGAAEHWSNFDAEAHWSCAVLADMVGEDYSRRTVALAIHCGFYGDPTARMSHLGKFEIHGDTADAKARW